MKFNTDAIGRKIAKRYTIYNISYTTLCYIMINMYTMHVRCIYNIYIK